MTAFYVLKVKLLSLWSVETQISRRPLLNCDGCVELLKLLILVLHIAMHWVATMCAMHTLSSKKEEGAS